MWQYPGRLLILRCWLVIAEGAEDEEDLFLWDRDQVDVKHRVKSRKSLNASLRFFESATLDLHGDRDLECNLRRCATRLCEQDGAHGNDLWWTVEARHWQAEEAQVVRSTRWSLEPYWQQEEASSLTFPDHEITTPNRMLSFGGVIRAEHLHRISSKILCLVLIFWCSE